MYPSSNPVGKVTVIRCCFLSRTISTPSASAMPTSASAACSPWSSYSMVAGTVGSTTVVLIAVESVRFRTCWMGSVMIFPSPSVSDRLPLASRAISLNRQLSPSLASIGSPSASFSRSPLTVQNPSASTDTSGVYPLTGTFSPALSSSGEVLPSAVTVQ